MMEPSNRERFLAVRRIASFTSRGFGVVATHDTVVRGTFGFTSFISVKANRWRTSGGRFIRWAMTFSLPLASV